MNDIEHFTKAINASNDALDRSRQALARHPDSPALQVSVASIERRVKKLEADLTVAAAAAKIDLIRYTFPTDGVRAFVAKLCPCLQSFQDFLAAVYQGVKSGPKRNSRINPEALEFTALEFGFTYAGSLGFALKLPNSEQSVIETTLDAAAAELCELATARSRAEVEALGRRLGVPAVRTACRWANAHLEAELGVNVAWIKGAQAAHSLSLQTSDLSMLVEAITAANDEVEDTEVITGKLVGVDIEKGTFRIQADEDEIKGNLSPEAITNWRPIPIPTLCEATIKKKMRLFYARDEAEVASHTLLKVVVVRS